MQFSLLIALNVSVVLQPASAKRIICQRKYLFVWALLSVCRETAAGPVLLLQAELQASKEKRFENIFSTFNNLHFKQRRKFNHATVYYGHWRKKKVEIVQFEKFKKITKEEKSFWISNDKNSQYLKLWNFLNVLKSRHFLYNEILLHSNCNVIFSLLL